MHLAVPLKFIHSNHLAAQVREMAMSWYIGSRGIGTSDRLQRNFGLPAGTGWKTHGNQAHGIRDKGTDLFQEKVPRWRPVSRCAKRAFATEAYNR